MSSGAPTNGPAVDRNRQEFLRAVDNIVRHAKRSLLDFLDFERSQMPLERQKDERVQAVFEYMHRRIHNDVSVMSDQVRAAFEIYCNGGVIPAFGRTEQEMNAQDARRRGSG